MCKGERERGGESARGRQVRKWARGEGRLAGERERERGKVRGGRSDVGEVRERQVSKCGRGE